MYPIPDEADYTDTSFLPRGDAAAIRGLALEYAEASRRSEAAWPYIRQPRDGPLEVATFSYLPEHHFQRAYDRLLAETEYEADGGITPLHKEQHLSRVYYWLDPDTGAALYHSAVNEDEANIFFETPAAAEVFLEQQVAAHGDEPYGGLSLYLAKTRKVGDATDVLTDQTDIAEFLPDGGRPEPTRSDGRDQRGSISRGGGP